MTPPSPGETLICSSTALPVSSSRKARATSPPAAPTMPLKMTSRLPGGLLAHGDVLVDRGRDLVPGDAVRGLARLPDPDAVGVHAGAGRGDPVRARFLDREALRGQDGAGVTPVGGHAVQFGPVPVIEPERSILVAAARLSVNGDLLSGFRLELHGAGLG